jgi:hypothetical protein
MKVGMHAEEIVMAWLNEHPQVLGVEDLRSLRPMREADVDVSLQLYDGRVVLAEIKSDYHLGVSGNVLFEVLRINHTCPPGNACTLGWSARSPATWLLFYAPQVRIVYRILFQDYRQVVQEFTRTNHPKFNVVRTDNIKTTVNILIPEKHFQGLIHRYPLDQQEERA